MKHPPCTQRRNFTSIILSAALLTLCVKAGAATYYVDYGGGSDLNSGLSSGNPLKHCPGDGAAPTAIKNKQLFPGDKVIFKGGVEYPGNLSLRWDGAAGNPIILDGNTAGDFGTGPAVFSGFERNVPQWSRCQSPFDAGYAPDWMNCYMASRATAWSTDPFRVHLFYDGERGQVARSPNAADRIYYNLAKQDYHPVDTALISGFSVTLPPDFNPAPEPGKTWENTWVSNWFTNDVVINQVVSTSPDGTELTTSGTTMNNRIYKPQSYIALFNHPRLLDERGEYVLADKDAPGDKRKLIFYAGPGGAPPAETLTSSTRSVGLWLSGRSHYVVQGITFTGFARGYGGSSVYGIAIFNQAGGSDLTIRNCTLIRNQSFDGNKAAISIVGAENVTVESCHVVENQGNRGISVGSTVDQGVKSGILIRDNVVRRNGRTGIFTSWTSHVRITGNQVIENRGLHGNGISVYQKSNDVEVSRNLVLNSNSCLTLQSAVNVGIHYNVFSDPEYTGPGMVIYAPAGPDGDEVDAADIRIRNNVIIGERSKSFGVQNQNENGGTVMGLVFENNIVDGTTVPIEKVFKQNNNFFLSKHGNGVTVGPTDHYAPGEPSPFVNAAENDFRLNINSWAVDNGVAWIDTGGDLEGNPIDGPRDVGAYEFQRGAGAVVLAAGKYHTVAADANGAVWTWGQNTNGQLGNGTTATAKVPQQLATISGVKAVAAGATHTLALKRDGTVWAWGAGTYGQLGNGTSVNQTVPVQVTGLSDVVRIGAGLHHSFAVKSDGTIWTWGRSNYLQLGLGNNVTQTTPQQVALSGVADAVAGFNHMLVLKTDGTVCAWGYNASGQLGDGTATNRSLPVSVPGLTGIASLGAGSHHSLAVTTGGAVYSWGANTNGQLGDGGTANRASAQLVAGLAGVRKVVAGELYTKALIEGAVWGWGANSHGQLGIGSTGGNSPVPVKISSIEGVTDMASGHLHGIHRMADGTLTAVGYNYPGQLGDNTATSRSLPVVCQGIDLD